MQLPKVSFINFHAHLGRSRYPHEFRLFSSLRISRLGLHQNLKSPPTRDDEYQLECVIAWKDGREKLEPITTPRPNAPSGGLRIYISYNAGSFLNAV